MINSAIIVKRQKSSYLLIGALIFALIFALYYYIVLPKVDERATVQSQVDTLNSEIATITADIQTIEQKNAETEAPNIFTLQKKVPQQLNLEEIVRDIEEVEAVTGTRIVSVEFEQQDRDVPETGGTEDFIQTQETLSGAAAEAQENNPLTTGEVGGATTETTAPVFSKDELPKGLNYISFSITVITPDYKRLQQFIDEFEKMERIFKVDAISFELPGEAELLATESVSSIQSEIQLTAFYYEEQ